MKIMSIFGTRPEAIKLAPIIKKIKGESSFQHVTCVTAQHREMLDQVLEVFDIKPDYDLDLMKENQALEFLSSEILSQVSPILKKEAPDYVLLQGDTTTVSMVALAAFYQGIKVAHLEAGLRTGDKKSPWPEEVNRSLVSVLSEIHFAPTHHAKTNLLSENIPAQNILVTGNSVVDALFMVKEQIESSSEVNKKFKEKYLFLEKKSQVLLATLHRRESHGEKMKEMCRSLKKLSQEKPDLDIIFSVHPNPNVKKAVESILHGLKNVHLISPPTYLEFVYLMMRARLILTDSGGIQEEAPSLNVPVLVARDKTERPEGVQAGSSVLVGRDGECIKKMILNFFEDQDLYDQHANVLNPFGDGTTSNQVLEYFRKAQKLRSFLDYESESATKKLILK